jgi:transcriptional regulator with XRE-family HTH domain
MKINTEYLKSAMEKRKIGVSELAQLTRKKESWIYAILKGSAGRSFTTVEILAQALNLDPVKLVAK